jgi:hypothetical protein
LRAEVVELLTPGKNPFHEHAKVQLFLARRGGVVVVGSRRTMTSSHLPSLLRRAWGRDRQLGHVRGQDEAVANGADSRAPSSGCATRE